MSGGAKECVNVSELDDIGFGIENISVLKKNTVAFQGVWRNNTLIPGQIHIHTQHKLVESRDIQDENTSMTTGRS